MSVMVWDVVEPHSFVIVHTHVPSSADENDPKLNVELVFRGSAILLCFQVTVVALGLARSSVNVASAQTSRVVTV